MARNPVTARERRGILAVAAVSLLVVGCGYAMRTCRNASVPVAPPLETLVPDGSVIPADSAYARVNDSMRKARKTRRDTTRRRAKKRKSKNTAKPKPSPRDYLEDDI